MKLDIQIQGDKEIANKLKTLEEKSKGLLKDVVTKAVIYVEGVAKDKAPIKSGRLRASISFAVTGSSPKAIEFKGESISGVQPPDTTNFEGRVGSTVEYAPAVEFGTRRSKKVPYLLPALLESKEKILSIIQKAFNSLK